MYSQILFSGAGGLKKSPYCPIFSPPGDELVEKQKMMTYKKYIMGRLTLCFMVFAALLFTSCRIIAFAPYKRTTNKLSVGDSVVLVSLSARELHLMDAAYVIEDPYKYTQQMLPSFTDQLKQSRIFFSTASSHLDTTRDLLYEAFRLLRRKNSDTLLLGLLRKNLPTQHLPVLLVMNAATPPNPYRSSGGFYGDGYVVEKDKGSMQIRSFVVVYYNDTIQYFDALKSGGRYRAFTRNREKADKINKRLLEKLVKAG